MNRDNFDRVSPEKKFVVSPQNHLAGMVLMRSQLVLIEKKEVKFSVLMRGHNVFLIEK